MNYWSTTLGVPADKLNVGFAAFGVAFRLANANDNGVGAPTSIVAPEEGCYTGQPGVWSYYETCAYIEGGMTERIPGQSVPYTVTEDHWVGYDDFLSVDAKTAHIATRGYGGAFVWALDLDDYNGGYCLDGTFPFTRYLKSRLPVAAPGPTIIFNPSTPAPPVAAPRATNMAAPATTVAPTTTTTTPTTTTTTPTTTTTTPTTTTTTPTTTTPTTTTTSTTTTTTTTPTTTTTTTTTTPTTTTTTPTTTTTTPTTSTTSTTTTTTTPTTTTTSTTTTTTTTPTTTTTTPTTTTTTPTTTTTTPTTTTTTPTTTTTTPTTTTTTPTTTTTTSTTTKKATTTTSSGSGTGDVCKSVSGIHANPGDPTTFYNCDHGRATLQKCPSGLVFKTSCHCCDRP
ncbi:integumentary mucin C.1-like [Periophthalmus magnuspinnatus]|uniref:integumentary mucin C.1-like n=1 Tax=Periophthalmus magnuspinnatus TaxID=409849 RepID=UPI002436DCDE|nr:integumentary mucin C.1-like [Periophthalmus magnuspinnatus]